MEVSVTGNLIQFFQQCFKIFMRKLTKKKWYVKFNIDKIGWAQAFKVISSGVRRIYWNLAPFCS